MHKRGSGTTERWAVGVAAVTAGVAAAPARPAAAETKAERLTRLNDILATLKSDGESKAEILSLDSVQNNLGCNQHPNVAGQQAMGNALATRLRAVMGW
jgi:hypothetical protein